MPLSYKMRRRLSVLALLVGLPAYIVTAVTVMNTLFPSPTERPHVLLELFIYIALGVLWAFPLKAVFLGVGKADPDEQPPSE